MFSFLQLNLGTLIKDDNLKPYAVELGIIPQGHKFSRSEIFAEFTFAILTLNREIKFRSLVNGESL